MLNEHPVLVGDAFKTSLIIFLGQQNFIAEELLQNSNMVDCLGEAKTSYRYAAPGQFSLTTR